MGVVANLLIYGDIHLSSKNYGAHNDYAKESLHYFREITKLAKSVNANYIIGLGDFTYGRFHRLEYRKDIEEELEEQNKICNGNRYELEGNHDKATYGMTEYEYYIEKGYLKPSTNLKIGNVNINMIDYHKYFETSILPTGVDGELNVVLMHDFFKFEDTRLPDYGKAVILDNFTDWFGVDHIVGGHIHKTELFDGLIVKDGKGHRTTVHYLGSMPRPSYRAGHMDSVGSILELIIMDNGDMEYKVHEIPLWKIEDSFNLALKEEQNIKKQEKEDRVDISDIVEQLDKHERNVGNPEDIIESLEGVDERYKKKAIELLSLGQA